MNELPPGMAEDDELFSRRLLAQILGVVIVSSLFVLALYLGGVIGNVRDDDGEIASTSVVVAQAPPTVPPADTSSSTTATARPAETSGSSDSSSTTSGGVADSTSPSTSGTGLGTTASSTAPPASAPQIVAVAASDVRAGSTDSCGEPTSYEPAFAFDSRRETAWMATGDGIGAELTIELAEPSIVSEVGLVPGYDKLDPCTGTDRFEEFRRITRVRWTFDDGTSVVQTVSPTRSLQVVRFDEPAVTSRITMTIVSTTEPGVDRLDHAPVSEVVVS